jgi:hypothetical protein
MPTREEAYLCDEDMSDHFVTDIWAAVDIEPVPVCLLPLDEEHDVPAGITVQSQGLAAVHRHFVRDGLLRYGRHRGGAADVDPAAFLDGSGLKLEAVWVPNSAMAERFLRPYDNQ